MVCVMGASGSGKSTLLQGARRPDSAEQRARCCSTASRSTTTSTSSSAYVSYIPQDDAFDEHLTIGENLQFAAAIRSPHLSRRDRTRRLESKLIELGLSERRDSVVGSPVKKTLSGGERKRLNIGLDMIGSADVYLFDEPTSRPFARRTASTSIEIIRGMAHNKIILVTIHQPSSKLFQMFSQGDAVRQRRPLVFFGTPTDMLRYFAEAEHQHQFGADLGALPVLRHDAAGVHLRRARDAAARHQRRRHLRGEQPAASSSPARRYSPDFWRDKYEAFRLIQDVKQVSLQARACAAAAEERRQRRRSAPISAGTTNGRSSARSCGARS